MLQFGCMSGIKSFEVLVFEVFRLNVQSPDIQCRST